MGFPKREYWSGLPFPFPGDLPYPGIKPVSPALAGRFSTIEPPGKPDNFNINDKKENKEGRIALMTELLVCTFFVCGGS